MKRAAWLCLLLCLLTASAPAEERAFTGYTVKDASVTELAPGVTYERYTLMAPNRNLHRGQRVNLLNVAPGAPVRLAVLPSGGRIHKGLHTVPDILSGSPLADRILGGVNADFFDVQAGGSLGWLLSEGIWYTAGEFPEGFAVGMTGDGELLFGRPHARLTLALPDGTAVAVDALNAPRQDAPKADSSPESARVARKDNELVLYTADYYKTTDTQAGGTEVLLRPDGTLRTGTPLIARVERVTAKNKKGGTALVAGTMVLSAVGGAAEHLKALKPGDTLTLTMTADPPFDRAVCLVGGGRPDGGPMLIEHGQAVDLAPLRKLIDDETYFYHYHPRTVVAARADGSYFLLALEGNRVGSRGMTPEMLQTLLTDLGAETALNLDGGPSTTMAVLRDGRLTAVTDTTGGAGRLITVSSALCLVLK